LPSGTWLGIIMKFSVTRMKTPMLALPKVSRRKIGKC
jgi:hypothetical protein